MNSLLNNAARAQRVDRFSRVAELAEVAQKIFAALENNDDEVLIDAVTQQVKQGLTAERSFYLGTALPA